MNGAEIVLATNIAVLGMFAASYLIVGLTNWSQRGALWFAATYIVGMLAPISELLVPVSNAPGQLELLGYASFLGATLAISASFSHFHHKHPPWRLIALIFIAGLIARGLIWGSVRDTLSYGFVYQLPLAAAALLVARTVVRVDHRTALHLTLAGLFAAIAVNLAAKPFFAAAYGSGATLGAYTSTTYALLSQASSGLLFLAAGMILMLVVGQQAITDSQLESETDLLSGVANRRGFDRQAQDLLARAEHLNRPLSVIVFDLDHFKRINDTHGHQAGDTVIADFGGLLHGRAPPSAIYGRMGGEEFAMVVLSSGPDAWLQAETIRSSLLQAGNSGIAATVSGGVAERRSGESLADVLRRADLALYQAKSAGRDKIVLQASDLSESHTAGLKMLETR
ncbi:GGDEF domain-containing protein [Polymorphobacter glacialis]|uniref:diguanylate cyclase n=1 Tax=Sandarakinorhabdus glacialis TaxID=1614636 RepID=A0A917A223_9SPHN|nr:GGDEF domain-containing protein [Polymorphobacter glacialis]GGE22640.1 GGDEF domain-containing protein [Polymorphobacter glacialis]